jgi:hypothetical protein
MSQFVYLLNAMERAAQAEFPAEHGYSDKRRAVLEYVAKLEAPRPEVQTWVPVEERLPAHGDDVLFVTSRNPGFMWYGWHDSEGNAWRDHFDDDVICEDGKVTHWMPAPIGPRES